MKRDELNDLTAFVAVAEELSFTRAAATLGMSPSALSHAVKALEGRLGVRLLARTTRSVATTDAGERLLRTLRPALEDISTELVRLGRLRDKPSGTLRITTFRHAATSVLLPVLPKFLQRHPEVKVEITVDEGLTDIVASRYDAGIRFGEKVAKDMIAVRVGPQQQAAVVASPAYFAKHTKPEAPEDLATHQCINYRFATGGGLYSWEFKKGERSFQVRVEGSLVLNDSELIREAAVAGHGIAYLLDDQVADAISDGRLVRVLAEWSPSFAGYYIYYTSRRHIPPALDALVEALRVRI